MGLGARCVFLSRLPVALTVQTGHLPPVTLTLGWVELQGAFAVQPNFGPGLGMTGVLETTRQNWIPFWILKFATWADLGKLLYLSELDCLT